MLNVLIKKFFLMLSSLITWDVFFGIEQTRKLTMFLQMDNHWSQYHFLNSKLFPYCSEIRHYHKWSPEFIVEKNFALPLQKH